MEPKLHPLASHDLPSFITAPGQTDTLLGITAAFLVLIVISLGVLYLNLHSLPERMSHRTSQAQAGLVAVLGLLALFTHNQIFWVMALLLAFIRLPDFETPLQSISDSLRRLIPAPEQPPSAAQAGTALPEATPTAAVIPVAPTDEQREG
ncbi:MAG: hypothetical protein NTW20_07705 [Rhodobacterales bacterium]|nr:hypothetical protein [Rhodobacterales bacterium]